MHQHGQAALRQQQCEQGRQHRQAARAVVAGQHDGGHAARGHALQPRVGGVEEAGHLLGRLALDAHREAERADLEVAHGAIEQLPEQVTGLRTVERTRALLAAADVLDVMADPHAAIVPEG